MCGIVQQFVAVCCSELQCVAVSGALHLVATSIAIYMYYIHVYICICICIYIYIYMYTYIYTDSDTGSLIGPMTGPITNNTYAPILYTQRVEALGEALSVYTTQHKRHWHICCTRHWHI